jgi:hypothetical protein
MIRAHKPGAPVRLVWYYCFVFPKAAVYIAKTYSEPRLLPGRKRHLPSNRYDKFWTRRYRAKLYLHERLKIGDFVDLLLVAVAATISAFGKPNPVYVLLGVYIVIWMGKTVYTIRTRTTSINLAASIVTGLLSFINTELFDGSNCTRFTIFRVAPYHTDRIIPWVRYRRGGLGGRREAFGSRARFQRDEGITGKVWEKPPGKLAIQLIPEIADNDRNLLRLLYERKYDVKPETVDALSEYMTRVR